MDANGGNQRRLVAGGFSGVPAPSPDGRDQLFVMDVASGMVTPLAASSATDDTPSFSVDGRFVAFTSTRDGGRDLYRVEVATGAVARLTGGLDVRAQPSWSRDGRRCSDSVQPVPPPAAFGRLTSVAVKKSRLSCAMNSWRISFGQAREHSPWFVQVPKPSASICATIESTRS